MDPTRLRYFLAVVDAGHVGRAASILHISQPALSQAIRQLEREAGVSLVARSGRGIVVTPDGHELARRARPIIAELSELAHDLARSRSAVRPVRYGSHETFGTAFAAHLSRMHDGMAFEHRYLSPEQIVDALRAGEIDAGISYIPVLGDGVEFTRVTEIPISIWGPRRLVDEPFDALPFAAPARGIVGSSARPQGVDAWPDETVSRRVRYGVTHTQTALELCRAGLAVAFLADFLVAMFDEHVSKAMRLRRIPMPAPLPQHRQPVFIATRAGESPRSAALLNAALLSVT